MILLQAGFLDASLVLWGETDEKPPSKRRRGGVTAHPRCAADKQLKQALDSLIAGLHFEKPIPIQAWLPTLDSKPLASSPMIGTAPESTEAPTIAPWSVETLVLLPRVAIDLLTNCIDLSSPTGVKPILAPGILVGPSLAFFTNAFRLACALVGRERFLPGLKPVNGAYHAVWELFPDEDGQSAIKRLSNTMPAACRALSPDADTPPTTAAGSILRRFLDTCVDQLVRSAAQPCGEKAQSLHDRWADALRCDDAAVDGAPVELRALADQLRDWRRPIQAIDAAPLRLCFRLEEPPSDETPWHVHYLLQAKDDPSLLVPVEEAISGKSARKALAGRGVDPKECALASLGQAARIAIEVEKSLKADVPTGFTLDSSGAYEFLRDKAGLLRESGFGVLLPSWWVHGRSSAKLTTRAKVKTPNMSGGGGLSMEQLLNFDWQISIGEEPLTLAELKALAKLKSPLVKLRGQWLEIHQDQLKKAISLWEKSGQATLRDLVRMDLGADQPADGLTFDFAGVKAGGEIGDFLDQLHGRRAFDTIPTPDGFTGQLRPYQERGYSWMSFLRASGLGACLADDMGLGKTIQTLCLIQRQWHESQTPSLLVCPTSVVGNWVKEAQKFTPDLPVLVFHGATRKKSALAKEVAGNALVITSYGLIHRDIEALSQITWANVILDEAQNIKNPQTKQAKAARALNAGWKAALTGTPVENHVGDLWSIMEFLNPGLLGSATRFKENFYIPIQTRRDEEAMKQLKRITGPFVLRRLKTDKSIISDLPEKMEMKVFCTLTKEQASLYQAVTNEAMDVIENSDGIERKGVILGMLSKLKQVCNHPAQFLGDGSTLSGRSGKLERLMEMLDEVLESGERALIFSQFAEMGMLIQKHIQENLGRETLFLHGGTSRKQRDAMVERFGKEDGPSIFVLSLKAGGTGLNLTAANHVFHFDRWWNPAVENQATDRAFRIGQKKNVQVHKYICVGTAEEKIDEMIERKKSIANATVGTGEGWLTELSNKQLREVFALRAEALA